MNVIKHLGMNCTGCISPDIFTRFYSFRTISTTVSAQRGLLIRNRTTFENTRKISTIVFDKTGTLTKGSHELSEIVIIDKNYTKKDILHLASGVEQYSEHHITKGVMKKTKELNLAIPEVKNVKYMSGKGLEGIVERKEVKVVGPNYLKEKKIDISNLNILMNKMEQLLMF